jgi:hypothetical protein
MGKNSILSLIWICSSLLEHEKSMAMMNKTTPLLVKMEGLVFIKGLVL